MFEFPPARTEPKTTTNSPAGFSLAGVIFISGHGVSTILGYRVKSKWARGSRERGFSNPFGQGYGSMSAPSKEFEKLVLSGRIEHFGNPVLRWMLASTVIKTDPAGNIKPDKEKSVQKIDGIVASIMALGEWMTAQAAEENDPYSKRGMLSFND